MAFGNSGFVDGIKGGRSSGASLGRRWASSCRVGLSSATTKRALASCHCEKWVTNSSVFAVRVLQRLGSSRGSRLHESAEYLNSRQGEGGTSGISEKIIGLGRGDASQV